MLGDAVGDDPAPPAADGQRHRQLIGQVGIDRGVRVQELQQGARGPVAQDLVTGWANQGKGRALWCVGEATYKVQTVLHPLEAELTWTNEAIAGAR